MGPSANDGARPLWSSNSDARGWILLRAAHDRHAQASDALSRSRRLAVYTRRSEFPDVASAFRFGGEIVGVFWSVVSRAVGFIANI